MYSVLLYYKIVKIQHPLSEIKLHKEICLALNLNGRILMNEQGINGTVGGSKVAIDLYKQYMDQHRTFKNIDWKESTSEIAPFPKMRVRYREEIITTEAKDSINICARGNHVNRDKFHEWLKNGEDMVLLDMRNDYEWEIGRFVNSVRPPMKYFRELKENMDFYRQFKDKKIVMFCTGGIRCEPASAYFLANGFDPKKLFQLEGGIVKYAEKYGDEGYYEGKCFVFDERLALPVDTTPNGKIIGNCLHCKGACDVYRNCDNRHCNKLFIGCHECTKAFENTCSDTCKEIVKNPTEVRPARANHIKAMHRNK